ESQLDEVQTKIGKERFKLYISMFVRFVMSGLVDADYLSTEAYFSTKKESLRLYEPPPMHRFQTVLEDYIDHNFNKTETNSLDELKRQVQAEAFVAGKQQHTFFAL